MFQFKKTKILLLHSFFSRKINVKKILFGFTALVLITFTGCQKEKGCTDPNAFNFDSAAEKDDGNCVYGDDSEDNSGNLIINNETSDSYFLYFNGEYKKTINASVTGFLVSLSNPDLELCELKLYKIEDVVEKNNPGDNYYDQRLFPLSNTNSEEEHTVWNIKNLDAGNQSGLVYLSYPQLDSNGVVNSMFVDVYLNSITNEKMMSLQPGMVDKELAITYGQHDILYRYYYIDLGKIVYVDDVYRSGLFALNKQYTNHKLTIPSFYSLNPGVLKVYNNLSEIISVYSGSDLIENITLGQNNQGLSYVNSGETQFFNLKNGQYNIVIKNSISQNVLSTFNNISIEDDTVLITVSDLPSVSTVDITSITENSAICNGLVIDEGASAVIERGVCWAETSEPTTNDFKTTNGSGSGHFSVSLNGLIEGHHYYVRTYATNSNGTAYGNQVDFYTKSLKPRIGTLTFENLLNNEVDLICSVITDGSISSIQERGFVYSLSPSPTVNDGKILISGGFGEMSATLTGLSSSTTYYFRGYATNSEGTSYSNEISFTTYPDKPIMGTLTFENLVNNEVDLICSVLTDNSIIQERGFVYSLSPSPTVNDEKIIISGGFGEMSATLTNLSNSITYYCRGYATNSGGTSYSNEISFTNNIRDVDGNVYTSVTIGEQEWMVENLRTTKYADGTSILNATDESQWRSLSIGGWCHYNNYSQYEATYGKLYNWYAVETGKLCPTGWHVPTDGEWTVLTDYLGANGYPTVEGAALKATSGWNRGNGTDNYGFLGLPGGERNLYGYFHAIGYNGKWWSSSQSTATNAKGRHLTEHYKWVGTLDDSKTYGYSVRCLRD